MQSVNRAVAWGFASQIWQVVSGLVTFVIVATHLSGEERGFYMTFWSFVGIQTLLRYGLTASVISFSSHEWTHLSTNGIGHIHGDESAKSRLISLGRLFFLFFSLLAMVFLVGCGWLGFTIFSSTESAGIDWRYPWLVTVTFSATSLITLPLLSLLEGCDKIESVYKFMFAQFVILSLITWIMLMLGAGLWTVAAICVLKFVLEVYFIIFCHRTFFKIFLQQPSGERFYWWADIWPFQWRLAIASMANYAGLFIFSPVIMYFDGAVAAGQMGMTRQLFVILQHGSSVWVQARIPGFTSLVARKRYKDLDAGFLNAAKVSLLLLALGCAAYLVGLLLLGKAKPDLSAALLDFSPSLIMLIGLLVFQIPFLEVLYLRCFKQEPTFAAAIASNLAICTAVWSLGARYGASGAAWGYLLAAVLVALPLTHRVWVRSRKQLQV